MVTVYVCSLARTWDTVEAEVPDLRARVELTGPGLGFLTIYGSEDQAKAENPGSSVFPIQVPKAWVQRALRDRPRGEA
jgi:hypothetical protein